MSRQISIEFLSIGQTVANNKIEYSCLSKSSRTSCIVEYRLMESSRIIISFFAIRRRSYDRNIDIEANEVASFHTVEICISRMRLIYWRKLLQQP